MKKILLIKLGGSIITDKQKPYTARYNIIRNIAKTIKKIKAPSIISHGSGSFGHTSAKIYGGSHGYKSREGLAKIARDAMEINRIVMDIFVEEKLPAISFRPLAMMIAKSGQLTKSFFDPILNALKHGFIPVVYGDIIMDEGWNTTIFSGETTVYYLVKYLLKNNYSVDKIIQLSDIDGVVDDKGSIVPKITSNNWPQIKKHIRESVNDVSGGMKHKIETALSTAEMGIKTTIINGFHPQNLLDAVAGKKVGTEIS